MRRGVAHGIVAAPAHAYEAALGRKPKLFHQEFLERPPLGDHFAVLIAGIDRLGRRIERHPPVARGKQRLDAGTILEGRGPFHAPHPAAVGGGLVRLHHPCLAAVHLEDGASEALHLVLLLNLETGCNFSSVNAYDLVGGDIAKGDCCGKHQRENQYLFVFHVCSIPK